MSKITFYTIPTKESDRETWKHRNSRSSFCYIILFKTLHLQRVHNKKCASFSARILSPSLSIVVVLECPCIIGWFKDDVKLKCRRFQPDLSK